MKYSVLQPLGFDRPQPYKPGETVTMTPEEAAPLIAAGVLGEGIAGTENAPLNVADTVKLVVAASTVAELDALNVNETRKGVLEAIAKRRTELISAASEAE
jgi:hypothetical protein